MSDVTRILNEIEQGDARAADRLLPLVLMETAWKMACKPEGQAHGLPFGLFEIPLLIAQLDTFFSHLLSC